MHFLRHCGDNYYKDWIINLVRALYGSGEEGGVGPFSVNTYYITCWRMVVGGTILCWD